MALNPQEEHLLHEIELGLQASDPALNERLGGAPPRRWVPWIAAWCLLAVGAVLTFAPTTDRIVAPGAAGLALLAAGWFFGRVTGDAVGRWFAARRHRHRTEADTP